MNPSPTGSGWGPSTVHILQIARNVLFLHVCLEIERYTCVKVTNRFQLVFCSWATRKGALKAVQTLATEDLRLSVSITPTSNWHYPEPRHPVKSSKGRKSQISIHDSGGFLARFWRRNRSDTAPAFAWIFDPNLSFPIHLRLHVGVVLIELQKVTAWGEYFRVFQFFNASGFNTKLWTFSRSCSVLVQE